MDVSGLMEEELVQSSLHQLRDSVGPVKLCSGPSHVLCRNTARTPLVRHRPGVPAAVGIVLDVTMATDSSSDSKSAGNQSDVAALRLSFPSLSNLHK